MCGLYTGSIKVQLYKNGKAYLDEVILNESNNWQYVFNNLPIKTDNVTNRYTIKEVSVNDKYKVTYGQSGNTITITNKLKTIDTNPEDSTSPETGDNNTMIYIVIAVISLACIMYMNKKRK